MIEIDKEDALFIKDTMDQVSRWLYSILDKPSEGVKSICNHHLNNLGCAVDAIKECLNRTKPTLNERLIKKLEERNAYLESQLEVILNRLEIVQG